MRQGARAMSAVIGLAVLLLGVSGCSGSDPSPADPASAHPGTAPPTASASATPTQDPGQAAIAAVQRMFDAYNAMLKSGSSKAYRATFTKDCVECLSNADTADQAFRRHRSYSGGYVTINDLLVDNFYPELDLVTVHGTVSQKKTSVVERGHVVQRFDATPPTPVGWNVSRAGGFWVVSRTTVLE